MKILKILSTKIIHTRPISYRSFLFWKGGEIMNKPQVVVIYNIDQANALVKNGGIVLGFKKHKETKKIGIVFKNDELFKVLMGKWRNYELPK